MTINRNFDKLFENKSAEGEIATLDDLVAGADYLEDTYEDVPLTGGNGSGATADITVDSSGNVTTVTLVLAGSGYEIGDILSADSADLGGEGSGFEIAVATITNSNGDIASEAFSLDNVKSEFRKPQFFAFGDLDGGSLKLQALRPDKNLTTANNAVDSEDWIDLDITITLAEIINLPYSTLQHRLVTTNLGEDADLTAFIVYNAE